MSKANKARKKNIQATSVSFSELVGTPVSAVIRAQANAALSTIEFMKKNGFDKNGDLIELNFNYTKKDIVNGKILTTKTGLKAPLLTVIPIPYMRIDKGTLEFDIKVTDTEYAIDENGERKLVMQSSTARRGKSGLRSERTHTMKVKMELVYEELPIDMEKVIKLLKGEIDEDEIEGFEDN